jgi:hypothetical protein
MESRQPAGPLRQTTTMMTMCAMTAILIGAVLGLRFKVLILAPAIVFGSAATLGIGMAHSHSIWFVSLAIVLAITALQLGYLAGAVIRFVIAGIRVRKGLLGTIAVAQRPAR